MNHMDYDKLVCWLIEFDNCWLKRNPTLFCRLEDSKALDFAFGSTQPTRTMSGTKPETDDSSKPPCGRFAAVHNGDYYQLLMAIGTRSTSGVVPGAT